MKIAGIDLGGTHLRAAVFDGATQLAEHRELVGEPRDPDRIAARVVEVATRLGADAVGIGIAAMLEDDRGTVANSPHLRWRDVPFGALVAARTALPFGVYNDVNAITWGEVTAGAARGCLEAYLGGSYLERRWGLASDLDGAAAAGDPTALARWTELAELFAVALGNAIAVLNPERLVLGGGVLARCPMLVELTTAALEIAAPRASLERLAVVTGELGDDAGLVGAASLVTSRPFRRRS